MNGSYISNVSIAIDYDEAENDNNASLNWGNNNSENIHFYVGASEEELIINNSTGNVTYSSSFDWNDEGDDGESIITSIDENDDDSWIHGWYDGDFDSDNNSLPTLYWDNLPYYINIFTVNIRIYASGYQ